MAPGIRSVWEGRPRRGFGSSDFFLDSANPEAEAPEGCDPPKIIQQVGNGSKTPPGSSFLWCHGCVSNFRSLLRKPLSQLFAEIGILWVLDKEYSVCAGTAPVALEQHPISKHIDISAAKHMNIHAKWGKQGLETVSVQIKACHYMVPNIRKKLWISRVFGI